MSKSDCCISEVLLYKQLNPPKYRTYEFRGSYMRERVSKAVLVMYDVHGLGIVFERFIYNNENSVVFIKYSYLSNKQREIDRKKNMKRESDRKKKMKRLRLDNIKKYVEDNR
jgi:hypothetical protein